MFVGLVIWLLVHVLKVRRDIADVTAILAGAVLTWAVLLAEGDRSVRGAVRRGSVDVRTLAG